MRERRRLTDIRAMSAVLVILLVILAGVWMRRLPWNTEKPEAGSTENAVRITQYGLEDRSQIMFYSITDKAGHVIMIDGGTPDYEPELRKVVADLGNHVDAWIITHPHRDHIGAFNQILASPDGIVIDRIYDNNTDGTFYETVAEPHDNFEMFAAYRDMTQGADNVIHVAPGDSFDLGAIHVDFFNAYRKEFPGYRFSYDLPNASSLVFRVSADGGSMLFLGDCEGCMEQFLDPGQMQADYIQIAHHGQNMNDSFYEQFNPVAVFVDAPKWLREGDEYYTKVRIAWYGERGVPVYTFDTTPNQIILGQQVRKKE